MAMRFILTLGWYLILFKYHEGEASSCYFLYLKESNQRRMILFAGLASHGREVLKKTQEQFFIGSSARFVRKDAAELVAKKRSSNSPRLTLF
jgi:hypothetical protein